MLRPGGKELTLKLIKNLNITTHDDVVEFAPGLGFTAAITLKNNPKSYTGVELNEEAAGILRKTINGEHQRIIVDNAAKTGLDTNRYSKVYGEAMLTMQSAHRKADIIQEASRILKQGGLYGIHELGLQPDTLSENKKAEIQRDLAQVIKVNARPLTQQEWTDTLEKQGFNIAQVETNPMHLLEKKRILADEGFFRTLKIAFNVLTHPQQRKRIFAMRKVFRKHQDYLMAISIVAQKA